MVNVIRFTYLETFLSSATAGPILSPRPLVSSCMAWLQGPDGGISASKYCYMGGFDATRYVSALNL